MGKILVLGNDSVEREGLAIALEFAGNCCFPAASLQEAVKRLKKESYELVLVNPPVADGRWDQIVEAVKTISPTITVILLSEDAEIPSGADDVITLPYSPVGNLSPQFSEIGKSQALLVLLPEEESLKQLSGLPERPELLNKLAVLYHFQEKYTTAERLYIRALKITEKTFGRQHPKVATIFNNLARLYHDQDRYADAEPLYKRSLAIVRRVFGPDHVKVARRLSNLAELHRDQERVLSRRQPSKSAYRGSPSSSSSEKHTKVTSHR